MTTQDFNDEMMNLIATDFQRRYEPNFAWANYESMYKGLPGLIGFWPGNIGYTGGANALRDMSTAGIHLARAANGFEEADSTGLRRWVVLNGSTDYFSTGDTAFTSILGTENAIASSIRGLTAMVWMRPTDATPSALESIIGKWNAGGQNSWLLGRNTNLTGRVIFSGDGSTSVAVDTTNALAINEWRFLAARFTPSAQIRIWEGSTSGLVTNENTTSIPATLFDSTADLAVGVRNAGATGFYQGDLSLIALCRAALPDLFIESIFNLTRPLFIRR